MFDIWSMLYATLLLASNGFAPCTIPLALFLGCGFPQAWWTFFFSQYTKFQLIAFWMPLAAAVTYWVNGSLLLILDCWLRPEVLEKFKIQKGKRFDQKLLRKVAMNIICGQCVTLVYAICCGLLPNDFILYVRHEPELPTGREALLHLAGMIFFNEVTFFYGHWAMHQKIGRFNLYAMVHKQHHEFTSPIGLTASYCHPVEMLVSNVLPLTFGAFFFHVHTYSILVWVVFAVLGTQAHHSGYRMPWVFGIEHQPNFHDYHHEKFNSNFGNMGILDTLHGTDKEWHKYLKERGENKEHTLAWFILRTWSVGVVGCGVVSHFAGEAR